MIPGIANKTLFLKQTTTIISVLITSEPVGEVNEELTGYVQKIISKVVTFTWVMIPATKINALKFVYQTKATPHGKICNLHQNLLNYS